MYIEIVFGIKKSHKSWYAKKHNWSKQPIYIYIYLQALQILKYIFFTSEA